MARTVLTADSRPARYFWQLRQTLAKNWCEYGDRKQALSELNARERRIFEARRLAEDPIPLGVLAYEIGVSGERMRQIEVLAFEKVRKAVQHRVAAMERPERRHRGPQAVSHGAPCAA